MRLTITLAAATILGAGAALSGEVGRHLEKGAAANAGPDAQAAADVGTTDATRATRELLDDPVRDADGLLQAESGGARPKENWMGCDVATRHADDACQAPDGG